MDLGLLLGIIGTIATIIFGFLSIDLFKRKKYPGKITYIRLSLIDLLNNIANNFDEIELVHEGHPINKNIIYIKGALINNGDIDINSKITEKDVSIQLPTKCKWLDIKSTDCSEGLNVSVSIDDVQKASFKFDLFRKNEFVQFEGLIESESAETDSDVLENELKFSHRIENTAKIERKVLINQTQLKSKKRNAIIYTIGLFCVCLLLIINLLNLFKLSKEDLYFRDKTKSSNIFYSVYLKEDKVVIKPMNSNEAVYNISIPEFNAKYVASSDKLSFWQKFKRSQWLVVLYVGVFTIFTINELVEINKARKLSKILLRD